MNTSVLVHIVTFNHGAVVGLALDALSKTIGVNFAIVVTDNASTDDSVVISRRAGVDVRELAKNIGFCGGQNSIVADFLSSEHTHLCILNPDVAVTPDCLAKLANICTDIATPKLLRGNSKLESTSPATLDAAGMILTISLRHFDRGSQKLDGESFSHEENVFGGTGACLMLSRKAITTLLLPDTPHDEILETLHPGILEGTEKRKKIFDEAFFAYREDAELAWRAQRLGLSCRYFPSAVVAHKRAVLPENRSEVSAFVNYLGVRNRFLLQMLHFSAAYTGALISGFVIRNLIVVIGVLFTEQSSILALRDAWRLRHRARFLRKWITARSKVPDYKVARWLNQESEPC